MKTLITGTAGFIGFHLANKLADSGADIIGLDNINDYYDTGLKYGRLSETGIDKNETDYNRLVKSKKYPNYRFIKLNLEDRENLENLFSAEKIEKVCHLAAQAGVRYSLTNPQSYMDSNLQGFLNILECSRHYGVKHLVFASSSSVYGMNAKVPFSVMDNVDHPVSLYAATKKANELMAYTYSHLYKIPSIGLRFFTVYGPWGRPDMAYYSFTKAILEGQIINVFNNGDMERDFTYIDDIIEGVARVVERPLVMNNAAGEGVQSHGSGEASYRLYNIGNSSPVKLARFIEILEQAIGKNAKKNYLPMQPGDVYSTYADVSDLERDYGFRPGTAIEQGIKKFVDWYMHFYKTK